eukprot:m.165158 g.165158  ORF g.165158 m.165158 type:complete len:322 (+) comp12524_c0_seq1:25-990(+)
MVCGYRQACLALVGLVGMAAGSKCPSLHPPGLNQIPISVGGTSRTFYVFIPDGLDTTPAPAIVSYHGCGSSPLKFEFESSMNVRANTNKWFNVYPEGTDGSGGSKLGWNAGLSTCSTEKKVNDVEFTVAIHSWMLENLCVDPHAIYAHGFSNGGSMIFNITCELPEYFAGFSFTGSTWPAGQYPDSADCGNGGLRLSDMKPVLGMCGSKDGCSSGIASWFSRYSGLFECKDPVENFDLTPNTKCHRHKQCGQGGERFMEYCMIDDLGHCWSGGDCCDSNCRSQSMLNPDAANTVIDFFKRVNDQRLERERVANRSASVGTN